METKFVSKTKTVPKTAIQDMIDSYLDLKKSKDEIELNMSTLKGAIGEMMESAEFDKVSSDYGTAMMKTRQTKTWSLDSVKEALGQKWVQFVTPDLKKIKAGLEGGLIEGDAASDLNRFVEVETVTYLEIR